MDKNLIASKVHFHVLNIEGRTAWNFFQLELMDEEETGARGIVIEERIKERSEMGMVSAGLSDWYLRFRKGSVQVG